MPEPNGGQPPRQQRARCDSRDGDSVTRRPLDTSAVTQCSAGSCGNQPDHRDAARVPADRRDQRTDHEQGQDDDLDGARQLHNDQRGDGQQAERWCRAADPSCRLSECHGGVCPLRRLAVKAERLQFRDVSTAHWTGTAMP